MKNLTLQLTLRYQIKILRLKTLYCFFEDSLDTPSYSPLKHSVHHDTSVLPFVFCQNITYLFKVMCLSPNAVKKLLKCSCIILYILGTGCQQKPNAPDTPGMQLKIPEKVDFNFHVRPILSDRCFACHGPDEKARKGDLRLDLEANAFASLDSLNERYAIVRGNLEESQLIHRITSTDPDEMMPPPESKLELSNQEIEILKKWVEQGAQWKSHWAFEPPVRPEIPEIGDPGAGHNPIDNFVLSRLEKHNLKPSVEASKEKLIRRLSFDFRGLPPTLQEIDAFVADNSPRAYEDLVESFLAQDTYGERMAMEWLDLARYADSHGYQDDIERSMWPWREWVIEAFNRNMPYNDFVTWQLAGDLLPEATYEQKLATGFNRNHKITQEVGVIDEEYRVTYVLDRVNTFSTAFLGLTVECAQCHDHKYDPISQKEYYQLFSFFNHVPEKGRVDYGVEVANPSLPLPDEKVEKLRQYVRNLVDTQQKKVSKYTNQKWDPGVIASQQPSGEYSIEPKGLAAWYPMDYIKDQQIEEVVHYDQAEAINEVIPVKGKFSGGLEFMGMNYIKIKKPMSFSFSKPFTTSFLIKSLDGGIRGPVLVSWISEEKSNFQIRVTNDKMLNVYWFNPKNGTKLEILTKETLPANEWAQIILTYDGSSSSEGVHLYMNGTLVETYIPKDNLKGVMPLSELIVVGNNGRGNSNGLIAGQLDELMFFNRALDSMEVKTLTSFDPISQLEAKSHKNTSDQKRLFYHQLAHSDHKYQILIERLREYKIREGRTEDIILKPTMVMADMDSQRHTYLLSRGQYDAPGEKVEAGTPEAVLPFDNEHQPNRLGLARWLFDPKNPLTARVVVNRYWQMIFGRGIVATPGDFGSQGTLPSHPNLLDWLAVEFQESGWNIKSLLKTMVMSSAYRQTAKSSQRLEQLDPENILLARGPQARLSAEMIRDHALKTSGLLTQQLGGPSVKPYQPKGLWLEVASGNQSLRKYLQDHNDELYRRSLYTFWKRTLPPPSMTIFDAPSREQCTIKRGATSTPMQALVLLNDPQFVEASRLLAARMINEGGDTLEEQIKFAFRLATSREPKPEEIDILNDLYQAEMEDFEKNPLNAKKLLSTGEYKIPTDHIPPQTLAAYAVVANAVLNLTESIMKG